MIVHFDNRVKNGDPFACGASAVSNRLSGWNRGVRPCTTDKEKVTCRRCQRSRAFQDAAELVIELMQKLQEALSPSGSADQTK